MQGVRAKTYRKYVVPEQHGIRQKLARPGWVVGKIENLFVAPRCRSVATSTSLLRDILYFALQREKS